MPIGIYQDPSNGIVEGAIPPLLIHTDKSKTKEKEMVERKAQRNGEKPTNNHVSQRFEKGLCNLHGIKVASTHSGSMTQEIFLIFAQHMVDSLPKEHDPIILLLDGHGSRWSVQGLKLLITNNIFPFFIASHTSIWAQPNDCGLNRRFHNCIEHYTKLQRRTISLPNVEYFNGIFSCAWRRILDLERIDLHATGKNTTTNAYEKTGMYPFYPKCSAWSSAIETLGLASTETRDKQRKVQYEIFPARGPDLTLSIGDKLILRNDDVELDTDKQDYELAMIRGMGILKRWRERLAESVQEGNSLEEAAQPHLPFHFATSAGDKIAIRLIEFIRVGDPEILQGSPVVKSIKERRHEATVALLKSTRVIGPVDLEYHLPVIPPSTTPTTILGTAIKQAQGNWHVFLKQGDHFDAEESNPHAFEIFQVPTE